MTRPNSLIPQPTWSARAVCADEAYAEHRDEIWYAHSKDREAKAEAVRICHLCPVRLECLQDAMESEGNAIKTSRFGVRGGLTPTQRRRLYEELQRRAKAAA